MGKVIGKGRYATETYPSPPANSSPGGNGLVAISAADTTPDFLGVKLAAGTGIALTVLNPGGDEQLKIDATGISEDHKVAVSPADTVPDFLAAKIALGSGLAGTILNPGGDEQLGLVASYNDALAPQLGSSFTQGALDALKGPTPSAMQQVFVSKGGSDTTGTGTDYKPFASIAKALAVIAAIGDNSSTKRYAIVFDGGNYAEALVLEPWVYIVGVHPSVSRITAPSITFSANWTPAGDHRAGFSDCTMAGAAYTFDFNTVSSNEGKLVFQNVTWNQKPVFSAFSAINQVTMQNCYLLAGHQQIGINFTLLQTSYQNAGSIDLVSVNDGRNLPTILSAFGGGTDGALNATWTASAGSNAITVALYGFPINGVVTLDGAQATLIGQPECITAGVTLLNNAPSPALAVFAQALTGLVLIGAQTQIGGSNAGIQYSSAVANRGAARLNQFGNNAGVPGVVGFKSRGATVPVLASVLAGDTLWRATGIGVTGNNVNVPNAAFISITVAASGPTATQVPCQYDLELTNAAGTRQLCFQVSTEGEARTLAGIRAGGPNTTPATIATASALIRSGNGDPNNVITGSVGDVWYRLDGGASTTLYVKESGAATNTGWVAYGAPGVLKGAGNPNVLGVLGSPGDIYTDTTDPVGSLYVKRSGVATTSGWFLVSKNVTPFTIAAPLLGGTVNTAATDTSPLTVGGYVSMGVGGVYKVNSISSNTVFQIINDGYASTETTLIPTGTEIIPVGTPQARQITSINVSPGAGVTQNFGPFSSINQESVWLSLSQESPAPAAVDQFVTPGVNVAGAVSYAIFKSPGDAANTFRIRVTNNTADGFLGELIAWGAIGLL